MITAVAILRTSTNDQATGMDAQRAAITAYAFAKDIAIVAWHEETITGAARLKARPTLAAAIASLQPGMVLLAQKWDRLSRDPRTALDIADAVTARGAEIQVADGVGNGADIGSEAMRGMLLVFSQYERRVIGARTKAALAIKRAQGVRLGRPPGSKNKRPLVRRAGAAPIGRPPGRVDTKPRKQRSDKGSKRAPAAAEPA